MKMNIALGLGVFGFGLMIIGVYFYIDSDNTAYNKVVKLLEPIPAKHKEYDERLDKMVDMIRTTTTAVQNISDNAEKKLRDFETRLNNQDKTLDVFREQCADTLNKQIKLQDQLSNKRPVHVHKGLTQIELYVPESSKLKGVKKKGAGVDALIKRTSR